MLLGVIADDFTGATDIAGMLVESGMRTVQLNGVPAGDIRVDADAVVISLKTRSCPVDEAIRHSLAGLQWLQARGCQQFYFKYCSTFDSTEEGNIGPVTDALLTELDEAFTILCPALPVNGRTLFNGYLFVHGRLLNESGMEHHPITPMQDANVVRLMNRQSRGECGLVDYQVIEQGVGAVVSRLEELKREGKRYAVVDAFNSAQLITLGQAAKSLRLVTGGSGLAAGIAQNWADRLSDQSEARTAGLPQRAPAVVLSGSCSTMTNRQVARYRPLAPHWEVDVEACLHDGEDGAYVQQVLDWVMAHLDGRYAPMIYATTDPDKLRIIQSRHGTDRSSDAVERFFSRLAPRLKASGVRNFIVAGGETSGTVVTSLGVRGFHIGPQIAPGVPWVRSIEGSLSLALKSGNFGDEHFFAQAQDFFHDRTTA